MENIGYTADELKQILGDLVAAKAPSDETMLIEIRKRLGPDAHLEFDEKMMMVSIAAALYREALMDAISDLIEKNNRKIADDLASANSPG